MSFPQPAADELIAGGRAQLSRYTPRHFCCWMSIPAFALMTLELSMTIRAANRDDLSGNCDSDGPGE